MGEKLPFLALTVALAATMIPMNLVAEAGGNPFDQGVAAFERGDDAAAIASLKAALPGAADAAPVHLYLAQALFRSGQTEEGLHHLLAVEPLLREDTHEDLYLAAWQLLLQEAEDPILRQRVAASLRRWGQRKIFRGGDVDLIFQGRVAQLAGEPREALARFRDAIREDPIGWMPRFYEGQALAELERFPDAERSYKVALERCKEGCRAAPIWRALGSLYEEQDRGDLALAAYLEAGDEAAVERLRRAEGKG